jgi:hypothetical protein
MRDCTLAAAVKTRVVAGAEAGVGGVEVVEGGRKRRELIATAVFGAFAL